VELKGDVMQFTYEFHRNGKLTKGLYSTIALIPKVDNPQWLNDIPPLSLSLQKWTILNG
jgi:hypothetical protein